MHRGFFNGFPAKTHLFSRMGLLVVLLKVALLGKLAGADVAFVRLATVVQAEVVVEVAALLEPLVATSDLANVIRSSSFSRKIVNASDLKPIGGDPIKYLEATRGGLLG